MPHTLKNTELAHFTRILYLKVKVILYKCSVVFLGAVLYLMYVMTVGEKMFFSEGSFEGAEVQLASTFLFVMSSCVSQAVFFSMSSYTTGIISSPITESFKNIQILHQSLSADVASDKIFTNLFLCMGLATLFTSAGFFLMYIFHAENAIKKIPSGISISLFVSIGFLCVSYANERIDRITIYSPNYKKWMLPFCFNVLGIAITLLCWICEDSFPAVGKYSVLWVSALFTSTFYFSVWRWNESISSLVDNGWLLKDPRVDVSPTAPSLVFSHIDPKAIISQILAIITIAGLNIIQFPINFGPTANQTGEKACARQEILANGVCNAITAMFGASAQVLPSSTITVHRAGSINRKDTLLFAVCLALIVYFGYRYIFYIPFVVFDILFLCLGLGFVLRSGLAAAKEGKGVFVMVFFVSLVSIITESIVWGAVVACALYMLKYLYFRCIGSRNSELLAV